ncbi:MAG: tRNA lysidine(34) synthetase TilS [Epsilonproteobacteria bacterium]|nr:tRNA lysidine(34) synthetase TilS [Campylobacterota bacterium]
MQPSLRLHEATLNRLRQSKNILAFSGGGDSTALFFLLQEHCIPFDIAHVNYQTRPQSNDEEAYAKELSLHFNKHLFTFTCKLENSNFEHQARHVRYAFFESLINEHHYENLLMAHHLGDKLEWFLMQLCKGAGVVELLGMQEWDEKDTYSIVRPLLHVRKELLKDYLQTHHIRYFEDESNAFLEHLRNHFRHTFATPLLENYEKGISKSFEYLSADAKRLLPHTQKKIQKLFILPNDRDDLINIRHIDKNVKCLGLLLSASQRQEILRTKSCVVGGKIAVCFTKKQIFIAPYIVIPMEKSFKEACRKEGIPNKIRPYLFSAGIQPNALRSYHTL